MIIYVPKQYLNVVINFIVVIDLTVVFMVVSIGNIVKAFP